MFRLPTALLTAAALAFVAGCGANDSGSEPATSAPPATTAPSTSEPGGSAAAESGADDTKFPDVKKAELMPSGSGAYTLAVTVSSPYDSPERYADGWRVLEAGTDKVLGMHMLGHGHASEQPFTREQADLQIPDGVEQITIEGRDQEHGFGGDTVTIDVPR